MEDHATSHHIVIANIHGYPLAASTAEPEFLIDEANSLLHYAPRFNAMPGGFATKKEKRGCRRRLKE